MDEKRGNNNNNNNNTSVIREYRKGNWTVSETMVLIEAKRKDEERRIKRKCESRSSEGRSKPAELRWKWVEDYCWRKGCLRSQNQCNDKWDNLMRDYKKVRDYQRRVLLAHNNNNEANSLLSSYWKLERNERKEKNLPTNMLLQIYEALVELVERNGSQKMVTSAGLSASNQNLSYVVVRPVITTVPPLLHHQVSVPIHHVLHPPPQPPPQLQEAPPPLSYSQPLPAALDSDAGEHSRSPAKRRRSRSRRRNEEEEEGSTSQEEVGCAISESISIIAEAIQACDQRKERRQRNILNLHERRLRMEESKTEINRQCINGLVDSINNLADSIFALASHKNRSTPN